MAHQGCTHVVIETTSEGIRQFRHKGIDYDATVFTNLAPEHLASHGGSFDAYKEAKGKLMASLELSFRKTLRGQKVEKMIIANNDSPFKTYFLQFSADKKWTFGLTEEADISAKEVQSGEQGVDFLIGDTPFHLNILGAFNVSNALPAILLAREFGVSDEQIQEGLKNLVLIPGRMERIDEGQPFSVFVDYAHEKLSLTAVMDTADALKKPGSRTILLLGAEGGGRDKSKRPLMGEVAATRADFVVVTNVDPYSDDPKEIIEDIAKAAEQFGKVRDKDLFTIEDRRMGIRKALCLAKSDDIVFITGKGAEQSIIIHGISSPWDDRTVVREELKRLHE
jgi:UDP-N-acetylmuramoyl-L-alanyl-D-glutamate--2,6-diaminopimelate ligase